MHLKILGHPIFTSLNFHMPMIVDLSHPLIMLQGENGAGKSTLLHSIFYALRGDQVEAAILMGRYASQNSGASDFHQPELPHADDRGPLPSPDHAPGRERGWERSTIIG